MRKIAGKIPRFIPLLLLVCLFFLSSLLPFVPEITSAQPSNPWFAGAPEVSYEKTIGFDEFHEYRDDKTGYAPGIDCIEKRVAKRAFGSLNVQYENSCWYATRIGLLSEAGDYLLQPGTSVAGKINGTHYDSRKWPALKATPNQDVLLGLVRDAAASSGHDLEFYKIDDMQFERTVNTTGTVNLKLVTNPTYIPVSEGVPSYAERYNGRRDDMWWSNDGNYLLLAKEGWLGRFNLETFKYLGYTMAEDNGSRIRMKSSASISPSGRYGALAVETDGWSTDIIIIDYDSCSVGESEIVNIDRDCNTKSFKQELKNETSFTSIWLPRFHGENTLAVYLHDEDRPDDGFRQYYLQAFGTERTTNNYLALGDSFSSGEGAGDYLLGTDIKGFNMCHTSLNSYPYLIDRRLSLSGFKSVACSGAEIKHYDKEKHQKNEDESSGRPGSLTQKQFIEQETPNIVTITMGGNDIGFSDRLQYCLLFSASCYDTQEERLEIANLIRDHHDDLVKMYEDIINAEDSSRSLYVIGYPQIMSTDQSAKCAENVNFNAYQRHMAHDLITYLNAVIKSAAAHAGAFYVGTEDALRGHKMCEGVSAFMGVNGLTFGDEIGLDFIGLENIGPISKASYHPNEQGHQLLSRAILDVTDGFTKKMPSFKSTAPIPDPFDYPFLNVPSSGTIVHRLVTGMDYDNAAVKRGMQLFVKYHSIASPYKPGSYINTLMKSETVELGQVRSDELGMVEATIEIPANTEPGLHELRLNGVDEHGKPMSVRQFIFVYAEENDYDGDGVLNQDELCVMGRVANVDADLDGIDDACDAMITPLPESDLEDEGSDIGYDDKSPQTTSGVAIIDGASDSPGADSRQGSDQLMGIMNLKDAVDSADGFASTTPSTVIADSSRGWFVWLVVLTFMTLLSYSVYKYANQEKK